MSAKVEQADSGPGGMVKGEIIQRRLELQRRRREAVQQEEAAEEERDLNALCWNCQRSAWDCLCEWPNERVPGMSTQRIDTDSYETPLEVVVSCPGYWPEYTKRIAGDS